MLAAGGDINWVYLGIAILGGALLGIAMAVIEHQIKGGKR